MKGSGWLATTGHLTLYKVVRTQKIVHDSMMLTDDGALCVINQAMVQELPYSIGFRSALTGMSAVISSSVDCEQPAEQRLDSSTASVSMPNKKSKVVKSSI